MIYLWEALLCIRMAQIPEKTIQFVHAPHEALIWKWRFHA